MLMQDLDDCPAEFRQVPGLIGMLQRALVLIGAFVADEASGAACAVLKSTAFQEFYSEVGQAVSEEKEAIKGSHLEAWRAWVHEAGKEHQGWAHRWTSVKDLWKPPRTQGPTAFSGKPLETLTAERDRLAQVWGAASRSGRTSTPRRPRTTRSWRPSSPTPL